MLSTLKHELKKNLFLDTKKNYILKTIIIYYKKSIDINFSNEEEPNKKEIFE